MIELECSKLSKERLMRFESQNKLDSKLQGIFDRQKVYPKSNIEQAKRLKLEQMSVRQSYDHQITMGEGDL